jgi:hypothetical protein
MAEQETVVTDGVTDRGRDGVIKAPPQTFEVTIKVRVKADGSDSAKAIARQAYFLDEKDIDEVRWVKPRINDLNMEQELELVGGERIWLGQAAARTGTTPTVHWHYERVKMLVWTGLKKTFSVSPRAFDLLNANVAEVWTVGDSGWVWIKSLSPTPQR